MICVGVYINIFSLEFPATITMIKSCMHFEKEHWKVCGQKDAQNLLCSRRLHLFEQNTVKNSNIVKSYKLLQIVLTLMLTHDISAADACYSFFRIV